MPSFESVRGEAAAPVRRRPHVCFVAPHLWPVLSGDPDIEFAGGAEVQQGRLARLLARNGHAVTVISQDYGQPEEVWLDGIRVLSSFRAQAGLPILRFFHPRLTGVWRALHRADADVYYIRAAGMTLAVVTAFCRRHGKKSVYAGASDGDFDPGSELIRYQRDRWLFRRGLAQTDAIVVQNENQSRLCLKNHGRASLQIASLYEPPEQPRSQGGDRILWVAMMRRGKRPEVFLELARRLPHRRFVMIGGPAGERPEDQAYYREMADLADELPNVEFLGFLPVAAVEPYFDQARVLVNTSLVEGVPNTFLQAWARGVPTIAFTDTGSRLGDAAVNEVVADAGQGAAAIERMFDDPVHYVRAASRCLAYFNARHGSAGILEQYQRLLDGLVAA